MNRSLRRLSGQGLLWVGLAALLLPGCALKSDLDLTMSELHILKQRQIKVDKQMKQWQIAQERAAAAKDDERASVAHEFQAESQAITSEVGRLGRVVAEIQRDLGSLTSRVKDIQNTQAIGLGSLSGRIDKLAADAQGTVGEQQTKLDSFATEVSEAVDLHGTQLTDIHERMLSLSEQLAAQKAASATLNEKLDKLGTKLTGEIADQSKRIATVGSASSSGASSSQVSALQKKVDFLGTKLPKEVDKQGKRVTAVKQELRDLQVLLSDLHKRLKAVESR